MLQLTNQLRQRSPDAVKAWVRNHVLDFGDYRRTIFLSGTGRGGTTWMSALLNYDNRFRDVFEPFHAHFVRSSSLFVYPLYLRPDCDYPAHKRQAKAILEGRVGNWWTNQANRRLVARRRLVKEVRSNLWVKWLKVNFPDLRVILLLRHPCAVAESRLRLEWPTHLPMFFAQRELMIDYLAPYKSAMLRLTNDFEKYVMACCIHYYVPLQQFDGNEAYCAFYESVLTNPQHELVRLFSFLGEPYDSHVFDRLHQPSWTTSQESDVRKARGEAIVGSWLKRVSPSMRRRAVEIMSWFGLDAIYHEDPLPSPDGIRKLVTSRTAAHSLGRHVDGGNVTSSLRSS